MVASSLEALVAKPEISGGNIQGAVWLSELP